GFAEDARKRQTAEVGADLFGSLPRGPEESFAYWFGGESGFGRLVRQGAWLDALERAARAADGHKEAEVRLGWGPRKALLEVLGPLAKEDMTNLQLVQMAREAGLFNDAIMEAARRAYLTSGFAALRPLVGGAIGGLTGGTAGAATDEEDRLRGFTVGATTGFVLGAGAGMASGRRAATRAVRSSAAPPRATPPAVEQLRGTPPAAELRPGELPLSAPQQRTLGPAPARVAGPEHGALAGTRVVDESGRPKVVYH